MRLFGTDGIRGIVSSELDAILAFKIGAATARTLKNDKRTTLLVGSDTRRSKDTLLHALVSGVLSENVDIIDLGIIPTPAVSHLIQKYHASGGFVISASHNPSEYNGIKVFNNMGMKPSDEIEMQIEDIILNFTPNKSINEVGTYTLSSNATRDYIDILKSTITVPIDNLKVCLDTANGSAYETAKMLFSELNVPYMIINDTPNGLNINENAGSTHLEGLRKMVVENNLDCGIAFDGDADRCMMIDNEGNTIDGDKILAIVGNYLKEENRLKDNTIVGTLMSNFGLKKFCEASDINFVSTKVGDRYVLESMLENDYSIGGEQSGHIIFKEYANTGDGELTALQVLSIMAIKKKSLKTLGSIMDVYPQVLKNIPVSKEGKEHYQENVKINSKIDEINAKLDGIGRVLVRPSGTENLIRVMLEGKDIDTITKYCDEIVETIKNELN